MEELDMQFKKLAAITGSALMVGLSLAAPVLATSVTKLSDISKLVGVSGTTVSYPIFVIGATAATSDVAGAVDMAVNLASNAVTSNQVSCTGGVGVSITGGVTMATASNPIVMWENLSSSKQTLTATDLPDILSSGTFVDANSVSTPFSQYLSFPTTNGQVVYDTRSGGTQPELGMRFAGSNTVYNYTLAFTKQVSETTLTNSVTNMVNTQISMLGKTWTITAATVNSISDLALTLLSGKNSQTVTTETPATYTVGSNTFTVTLVAVGKINLLDAATITVSGGNLAAAETLQILSGGTKSLSDGTLVGVTSIFTTTKTGAIDSATIFIGADKLELEDTNMTDSAYYAGVKLNGQTVTDIGVSMSGNSTATTSGTTTLNSIAVAWTPSLEVFKSSGSSISDPFTNGAWKIFFGGISPALDDSANREMITITPSGTSAGVSFKDASGNSLNQNFVKALNTTTVNFTDAGGYGLHVLEGEAVGQNEYMVLGQNSLAGSAQNPFGHIIRVLSLQTSVSATSQLQDVATGTTIQITGGNTTLYLDGQSYQVCVPSTSAAYFVWGSGATCSGGVSTGSAIDVFPAIQTSKGGWVSLTNPVNITGLANQTYYNLTLPTGSLSIQPQSNTTTNYTVGSAKYGVNVGNATNTTSWIAIKATDNNAVAASVKNFTTPGIMVVEGLDASQARNIIAVRLIPGSTTTRVEIAAAPYFTGSVTATPGISGTTQNKYVDTFGSFVTYDSTGSGTFSLSYPSSQAVAAVGVGKDPVSSFGGAGGTITTQTVLPITSDVVRLDSEVTDADKTGKDLILVGGPCINTLVASLATSGKFPYTCTNWPGRNFGRVQLIADAFATGKTALVVAGTRADETDLAAQMVQQGFPGASDTIKNGLVTEVTGSVTTPAYS
jgi:hypothetical protein